MSRRRWILVGLIAAVALVAQAGAAAAVWRYTRPRLPALAGAVPALDRAIALVIDAAGQRAAVAIGPLVPVASCADTPLAKGSRVSRTADLYTDPGQEDALIGRIGTALPAGEHTHREAPTGGGPPPLTADLGNGLRLHVTRLGQGWLTATAETDCRALTGSRSDELRGSRQPARPAPTTSAAPPPATSRVLAALDTTAATTRADTITCVSTVATISTETNADNLRNRLADTVPATAHRFVSSANRLAWRDGVASVVAAASDDGRHVTVQATSTAC